MLNNTDRISTYFKANKGYLALITITGLIYNAGLLTAPYFEGQLVGTLAEIVKGNEGLAAMVKLVAIYLLTIFIVQLSRYLKRLYVRKFSNKVSLELKGVLFHNLIKKSKREVEEEDQGSFMTKAISDAGTCAEGMRKATTEVFDTGIALIAYCSMLFVYDLSLSLIAVSLLPLSYLLAEKMKKVVVKRNIAYKTQAGVINSDVMDRSSNALLYRIYGVEKTRDERLKKELDSYEKKATAANVIVSAMPPLYELLSMISVVFIIYFGSENIMNGIWDIAAFTTFLSVYTKLAVKSSKAAKLFTSIQSAEVSWSRIKPLLTADKEYCTLVSSSVDSICIRNLSFAYPGSQNIFTDLNMDIKRGEIIGITGAVASGKSTLARVFLNEYPYQGSIKANGVELSGFCSYEIASAFAYMGHHHEVINASIKENIALGDDNSIDEVLNLTELSKDLELTAMTLESDARLISGGQKERLALARTLYNKRPVLILDDPFSALDRRTENMVFTNLKKTCSSCITLLTSHRLAHFPECDQIVFLEDGRAIVGTHEELMKNNPAYKTLYLKQEENADEK